MKKRGGLLISFLILAASVSQAAQNIHIQSGLLNWRFNGAVKSASKINAVPVRFSESAVFSPVFFDEEKKTDKKPLQQFTGSNPAPASSLAKSVLFGAIGGIGTAVTIRFAAPKTKLIPATAYTLAGSALTAAVVYGIDYLATKFRKARPLNPGLDRSPPANGFETGSPSLSLSSPF